MGGVRSELATSLLHWVDPLFQCVLGFQPALAPWTPGQIEAPAIDEWFRHAEEVWSDAHVRLQRTVHRQKGLADRQHSATPVYHPTTLQSVQGRRLVKEGFLSHETIETLTVYVCHSEVELARPKIEVPLNGVW